MRVRSALLAVLVTGAEFFTAEPALAQTFSAFNCGAALFSPELEVVGDANGLTFYWLFNDLSIRELMGGDSSAVMKFKDHNLPNVVIGTEREPARVLLAADVVRGGGAELLVVEAGELKVVSVDGTYGELSVTAAAPLPGSSVASSLRAWAGTFRRQGTVDVLLGDTDSGTLTLYELIDATLHPVVGVTSLASNPGVALVNTTAVLRTDSDLDGIAYAVAGGIRIARLGNDLPAWETIEEFAFVDSSARPLAVAIGDFDGDERIDVAAAVEETTDGGIVLETWLQSVPQTFSRQPRTGKAPWASLDRILVGDIDLDGQDDIVTAETTARWGNGTWKHSAPLGFARLFSLNTITSREPQLMAADSQSRLVRAKPAHSELSLRLGNSVNDTSGPTTTLLSIHNGGPSATQGLAFTTELEGATITVEGCADTADGCPDIVLPPNHSVSAILSQDRAHPRSEFDVAVCSGAPGADSAEQTVHVPLTNHVLADLGLSMATAHQRDGRFTAVVYAKNNGPAFANEVRLRFGIEPGQPISYVEPEPAHANCTTLIDHVDCTLDILAPGELLHVGVDLVYYGEPLELTATVSSNNPDDDLSRNTYVLTIPGGLQPAASNPSRLEADDGSGCTCSFGRGGGSVPFLLLVPAAFWMVRSRVRRNPGV